MKHLTDPVAFASGCVMLATGISLLVRVNSSFIVAAYRISAGVFVLTSLIHLSLRTKPAFIGPQAWWIAGWAVAVVLAIALAGKKRTPPGNHHS